MNRISISPSTLASLSCLRKYKYSKIDRWGKKASNLALEKGDFFHKILEAHYKLKQNKIEGIVGKTIEIARKLAIDHKLEIETTENLLAVYREYALKYASESWNIDFVEQPFNLPFFATDKTEFYLEGKIDLGITQQGKFFPVDHKTGGKLNEMTALQHQFLCYCFVTNTKSILINRIVFTKTPQFVREIKSFDADVLEEWKEHAIYLCQLLEVAAENDFYPQDLSQCWGCHFDEVCLSRRDIREFKLKRDFVKTEPYDLFKK